MRTIQQADGRVTMFSDNRELADWEMQIHWLAMQAMGSEKPSALPIECVLEFIVPTPKSHEGELWPIGKRTGDLDKLTRAILDGMTHSVYLDDSQVVRILASKRYASASASRLVGVRIWCYEIPVI